MEWSKSHVQSTLHICWGAQAGLYYHFGVKKYLMEEKLSPSLSPQEQLKLFVTIMWKDFNTYRHLRLEYLRNNPVLHLPHRPPVLDFLKRIIEQGIASGEFRETDSEEAALFVFCSLLGKFRHFLLKQLEADTEKETEVMLSFLLPALKKN